MSAAKKELQETYDLITEEELDKAIKEVENADERAKHGESWKLINEISGRKAAKTGIIKGKSKEERLDKWYSHFKDLLGKEHTVEGELDEIVHPILRSLGISDQPFTQEEYEVVKKSLVV